MKLRKIEREDIIPGATIYCSDSQTAYLVTAVDADFDVVYVEPAKVANGPSAKLKYTLTDLISCDEYEIESSEPVIYYLPPGYGSDVYAQTFGRISNPSRETASEPVLQHAPPMPMPPEAKPKHEESSLVDLLLVASEAHKDGLVKQVILDNRLTIVSKGKTNYISLDSSPRTIQRVIDFIKSLYTEMFTILNESDISRIKPGAEIELSNGSKSKVARVDVDNTLSVDGWQYSLEFLSLRGAFITQKKNGGLNE